jgi:nucleotide-binding universal stress UspA family protein
MIGRPELKMRILFGYNGSLAAKAAIEDLKGAGLPADSEILVLTVAESWSGAEQEKHEALCMASEAARSLQFSFPRGNVTGRSSFGSPAAEILTVSEQFQPDLIVLAEREQSLKQRNIFLGTTTQKVLREAECSVRIARGHGGAANSPEQLLIGFDGSEASQAAVESVARRNWPQYTEVCLAVVVDSSALSSLGRFAPQMSNPDFAPKVAVQWGKALADTSLRRLSGAGLNVGVCVTTGNAKEVLVELAQSFNADSVFVGPHCAGNSFERDLIGSVSSTVAARAESSVEIVRGYLAGN